MVKIKVDGKEYQVEFRHVTKLGKRAQLFPRAPIKAITTCVVVAEDFVAIDNAICANEDNFSRQDGRSKALRKLLKHCGALGDVKSSFWSEFQSVTKIPSELRTYLNGKLLYDPEPKPPKISAEDKAVKIAAGHKAREARAANKTAGV